ncbi:hypothetical protein HNQ59_001437 [Chitinivorax tropicus]|uniref:Cytochrome C oxidase subunit III n=1 Tax=Chitinivorax tropicus TaxID=714531 RepID=A0A840MN31_9PROT|nr:hypothetical protein [Chitinivorax tropicus]MBB5018152.1 hypothetical protein [Chitinivorax tropicus]
MSPEDKQIAARAALWNLLNITLLPGLAFALLVMLARLHWQHGTPWVRGHVRGAVATSIWSGVLLVAVSALLVWGIGWDQPATWVALILYFTCCHSALILFSLYAWSRAAAGKAMRYPWPGLKG